MLNLDLSQLNQTESYQDIQKQIDDLMPKLNIYKEQLLTHNQGWLDLPETAPVKELLDYAASVKGKFEHIVILGIGGSALGVTATFKALKHYYWNNLTNEQRDNHPKLHTIDNIDPHLISGIKDAIDLSKTLFITITKSGRTPETISLYLYFSKLVTEQLGDEALKENFVFVTDPENGLLRQISAEKQIPTFDIPQNVGGRFSVLTPVGLLPAALLGIDIKAILTGATSVRDNNFKAAYKFAALQYLLNTKHGININILMPYSSALFTVADWYRQLLAESIGKEQDRDGNKVNTGITPINALGVTDQHSQVQLYNEGPQDKLIIFLTSKTNSPQDHQHKIDASKHPDFSYLNDVTFKQLIDVEQTATAEAITKYDKATAKISIDTINENSLGEIYMFFELATGILGELYNIDAFNQPGVELGKVLTKEKLNK